MDFEVLADADAVARRGATLVAAIARDAIRLRGRCVVAVSGGRTPWAMLSLLAREDLRWDALHVVQVDERVAPAGDPDRNLTHLRASLAGGSRDDRIHPMPVECADLNASAASYAETLTRLAGSPPVLDLVHLGLGGDGHTASLLPNDAALDVVDHDVAIAGPYQGHLRMTLTYPVIDRARRILWVVTGAEKAGALARLRAGDRTVPAGRVRRDRATVVADRAAAGKG
jgi:6-phosphogluconolactonase